MAENKPLRVTFFSKDPLECPVCETNFYKEELLTGSGRLIAGEVTDELRRLYEPSKKYGAIFPLIYPVVVCPICLYSAFSKDFLEQSAEPETIQGLTDNTDKRKYSLELIFDNLDFTQPRDIEAGAASYFLAIMCYDYTKTAFSPTIKNGISALRAAWLFDDLQRKKTDENYDYMSRLFYRKARFYYLQAISKEQTGKETMSAATHLGPDLDKNYGYDGVLYLAGLLEYRYGPVQGKENRIEKLDQAKKIIAKVHGMGRASKSRPSLILDKSKDLYSLLSEEHKVLSEGEASE